MSIKNTIEIILSATDRASDAINKSSSQIKNSLENLNQWAFKNEISLQRMHNTGKEALK